MTVLQQDIIRVGVAVDDLRRQRREGVPDALLEGIQPGGRCIQVRPGGRDGPVAHGAQVVFGIAQQGIALAQGAVQPGQTFADSAGVTGGVKQGHGLDRLSLKPLHQKEIKAVQVQHIAAIRCGNDGRGQVLRQ